MEGITITDKDGSMVRYVQNLPTQHLEPYRTSVTHFNSISEAYSTVLVPLQKKRTVPLYSSS